MKVSYGGIFSNVGQQFLQVAKQFDARRDGGMDVDPTGHEPDSVNHYGVRSISPSVVINLNWLATEVAKASVLDRCPLLSDADSA